MARAYPDVWFQQTFGSVAPIAVRPFCRRLHRRVSPSTGKRRLFLTFDDGPSRHTPRLADLLGRYDAAATFFVTGSRASLLPGRLEALLARGHEIGNHLYSHRDPWTMSRKEVVDELDRTHELIAKATGTQADLVRPPYGHWRPTICRWCANHDAHVVLWNRLTADWLDRSTGSQIGDSLLRRANDGDVVVMHDGGDDAVWKTVRDALNSALPRMADEGWSFRALSASDLAGLPRDATTPMADG